MRFAVVSHENITERKLAEIALESSRAGFHSIVERTDEGIVVLGADRRIAYMNRAAEELLDCEPAKEIGRPLKCPVPGEQYLEFEVEENGKVKRILETRGVKTEWYSDDARLVMVRDVSERKRRETEKRRLEDQRRQAQKMEAIGTLAGGIAHDFNNILGAILGYAQMAQICESADPKQLHYLTQIVQAGKRARDLVKQILTFSRKSRSARKTCDLRPVVEEALELLRASPPADIAGS